MNRMRYLCLTFILAALSPLHAQEGIIRLDEIQVPKLRKHLHLPQVNGLTPLKCDFHMHTVFTDGHVWPSVRVNEAWQEGLDSFAFTEHVEYAPNEKDVTRNVSRSYELARQAAAEKRLTLIKGLEITRNTPPGHFNALFVGDTRDYIADRNANLDEQALQQAAQQNAFIFWNHPGWKAREIPGSYEWTPFVEKLFQEKKLHGIEVANGFGIHTKAIDWAIDRNLTILANSDIHQVVSHEYNAQHPAGHRTMTLVFARDRSPAAIREALDQGHTLAWAGKYLIGRESWVRDLTLASLTLQPAHHSAGDAKGNSRKFYQITNTSSLIFELRPEPGQGLSPITLLPSSSQILIAPANLKEAGFQVTNTLIRSDRHLTLTLPLE